MANLNFFLYICNMKKIKPRLHNSTWVLSTRDNGVRKYNNVRYSLEDEVRNKIRNVRDYWRIPYSVEYINEHQWELPESERKSECVYYNEADMMTILKYIPLFKKILDEEWPEGLKMWTPEEYGKLIAEGKIKG